MVAEVIPIRTMRLSFIWPKEPLRVTMFRTLRVTTTVLTMVCMASGVLLPVRCPRDRRLVIVRTVLRPLDGRFYLVVS